MDSADIERYVKWYSERQPYYQELAEKVKGIIIEILQIENVNYALVQARAKSIKSFKENISERGDDPDKMHDLAGIRIVGYVRSDVKRATDLVVKNFEVDKNNIEDKSSKLGKDKIGYRSVHILAKLPKERTNLPEYTKFRNVLFEIQIRTILEHAWAEIEHDRNYKYSGLPDDLQRQIYLLSGHLEEIDGRFQEISDKIDHYKEEISNKRRQGKLDTIKINPTALKQYFHEKFADLPIVMKYPSQKSAKELVSKLNYFGIVTLKDFESLIPKDFVRKYKKVYNQYFMFGSIITITHDFLIMRYGKEAIEKIWQLKGATIIRIRYPPSQGALWREFGINPEKFRKYGLGEQGIDNLGDPIKRSFRTQR